ncbi:MAG: SCO family protein [Anaerolineae bacterium]|nr:SCO family protein [Chloroflexi bacterium CFX2]MCQ3945133.1 SCO family protein [Anaerolineae bacterium]MCZ7550906.1 SCO family protein [Anaerolineales bacterium]GER79185.1 cytochrome oxidase Cu insertion factor [Candidatus Denitrolinea symbiosum]
MNKKISFTPLIMATAVLGIALAASFIFRRPHTFHGAVIDPPLPVTDFTLQTANDVSFRLSDAKGKIVLLFFGYTSCPDVCPVTLATFKQVHERLGEDAQKIAFVMITADPDRDTPDKVAEYTARFNPEFIGLSGSLTDLEPIWKELGVFVEKQDTGSAAGYLVSHTASVYVIDQDGNLLMTFPYGTSATDMADDLIQLLKQSNKK